MRQLALALLLALLPACAPDAPAVDVASTDTGCYVRPLDAEAWVGPASPTDSGYMHLVVGAVYGPNGRVDSMAAFVGQRWGGGQDVPPATGCLDPRPPQWSIDHYERGFRGLVSWSGDPSSTAAILHVHDYATGAEECWYYSPSSSWSTLPCFWFYLEGGVDSSYPRS